MIEPLKPCPFCGQMTLAIFQHSADSRAGYVVACLCGARGPIAMPPPSIDWVIKAREQAVRMWNSRAEAVAF